jgi:hypothetical protein
MRNIGGGRLATAQGKEPSESGCLLQTRVIEMDRDRVNET